MPSKGKSSARPESLIGRMLANLAWLAGGKGFGAVCSLVYLAILTRSLGLKDFGHFSLIFGTAQALIGLTAFQTWQTVVRYGAEHIHRGQWDAFGRLTVLAGLLDVVGGVLGTIVAYVVFYHFADTLELNPTLVDTAFWFNVASVWALVSAPTGVVRALDRFDVAIYVEAIVPLGRLAAAVAIWMTGPSLVRFLIAWAAIDLIEAALYWIMARRLCPQAVRWSHLAGLSRTREENPGVVRFFGVTYATTTIDAVYRNGPLLAVGYVAGTSAAGVYRLAQQLAQGLAKLSTLMARAAYAEIARARVSAGAREFRKLVMQTSKVAGGAGLIVMVVVGLFGGYILGLLGGDDFAGGYVVLVPLTLAACFQLGAVAFEPVLHAAGKAQLALLGHLVTLLAATVGVAVLLPLFEAPGAAWGVVVGALIGYFSLGAMAIVVMRGMDQNPPSAEQPD